MNRGRSVTGAVLAVLLSFAVFPAAVSAQPANIDDALAARAKRGGWSRVIVTLKPGADATTEVTKLGGKFGRRLKLINAMVIELPNGQIKKLAGHPSVARLDFDRPTEAHMSRVANLVGARYARAAYGYDGAGIGVAVIDSGVANWHDDLTYSGSDSAVRVSGNQRVAKFVDFVAGALAAYDDFGHGTHVSGIIAGNGYDSGGKHAGIAPASHIVSLKVLDGAGRGVTSDVIAAIEYAITNRAAYNIRVINLSVGAAVTTSYNNDPLAQAARRAVDAGIVVVAAAGNAGRNALGQPQYGAITAPGNAPWVLTVGASTHNGTLNRLDDTHAGYSSRGPTRYDYAAKPDILAPGTGVVALASPNSLFYTTKSSSLVSGTLSTVTKPYLSLSGTSMAAPVAAGTVALMLQANPGLTPNLVKAILQYTAQLTPGVDYLTQGGGFLNAKGAVDLARHFRYAPSAAYLSDPSWSRAITWGNVRIGTGTISPLASAWAPNVVWGTADDANGENVVWGTADEGENVVWGTACEGDDCENVVWGTACDGDDCENVVWGTGCEGDDCENVVWGTACEGDDCENVVWGTAEGDPDAENVVWGTADDESENVVWGTDGGENVVWGTSLRSFLNLYVAMFGDIQDEWAWQALFQPAALLDQYYDALYQFYVSYFQYFSIGTTTTTTTTSGGIL